MNELHQYKLHGTPHYVALSKELMDEERDKSANATDVLIILSTFDSVAPSDIPPNTAVVTKANFEDYYGPVAARAFYLSNIARVNANTSPRSVLLAANGIGDVRAQSILEGRKKQRFTGIDDCATRTGIPRKVLEDFDWM